MKDIIFKCNIQVLKKNLDQVALNKGNCVTLTLN